MLTEVKKHLTPKQIRADAEFFFLLNLGLVATAAGIALFKTPNHFAFGGTSGLSIVLATLFPRFNVGAFMWVVNAVLVVLGFIFLGIRFTHRLHFLFMCPLLNGLYLYVRR